MEYWAIELWENEDGVCKVSRDLLKKMAKKEKIIADSLREKMERYTNAKIEIVQFQKDLEKVKNEDHMWELKFHLLKNEIRFLGCLISSNGFYTFYALYAFKKKNQEIMNKHRLVARGRIKEFTNNFNNNELQKIL